MVLLRHILLITVIVSAVSAKSFLQQLFGWDFDLAKGTEQRDAESETAPTSNCVCDGPGCICCTDFNLTYIDLGGPGCVRLKYISADEGMAVNVSYGDSLLHSEVVKGPNPEPTCMNILTDLAQICARFSELNPTSDGVKGCLHLEPRLLGDSQAEYDLGCFKVGPEGMTFDPPANNTRPVTEKTPETNEEGTTEAAEEEGPTEEEVIAAVNETAEQGLAFLSSLLGFNLNSEKPADSSSASPGEASEKPAETSTSAQPADQGRAYSNPQINEIA